MKTRKHHNNTGYRQIKRGKTAIQLKHMCKRLKLPFKTGKETSCNSSE